MQWIRSLFQRSAAQIPEAMWLSCITGLPFLQRLTVDELAQLKKLCETFLDEKAFTAASDVQLTDDIAVQIAVQACLPVLHLTLSLYDDIASIVVYPSEFIIPRAEMDEAGVVHEWSEPASGEAIGSGGAVVLAWDDVQERDIPGYNVVIHEFVHKIDMRDGTANGCPPFLAKFHQQLDARKWQNAFSAAYSDFCRRIGNLHEKPLPRERGFPISDATDDIEQLEGLALDPYAATHPAEFFAVASEAFFVRPLPLAESYPDIYYLLSKYYHQNPLNL